MRAMKKLIMVMVAILAIGGSAFGANDISALNEEYITQLFLGVSSRVLLFNWKNL